MRQKNRRCLLGVKTQHLLNTSKELSVLDLPAFWMLLSGQQQLRIALCKVHGNHRFTRVLHTRQCPRRSCG
jgi:hypothetical protein